VKLIFTRHGGGLVLSMLLLLTTAGCFRPASEAAQSETIPTTTIDSALGVIPSTTADAVMPFDTPTPLDAIIDPATVTDDPNSFAPLPTLTPTSSEPTLSAQTTGFGTPTVIFITPGSPLGFITPEANVPTRIPPIGGSIEVTADASAFDGDPETTGLESFPTATATPENACTYIVLAGDNLYGISLDQDVSLTELRAANPALTGTNPVLQIDQELFIPRDGCPGYIPPLPDEETTDEPSTGDLPTGAGDVYVVQAGDTLSSIASRFGTTISELIRINELTNPDRLSLGQELIIPGEDN